MSEQVIKNVSYQQYSDFCDTTDQTLVDHSYPALMYHALGFAGESGEVANKIKKVFRDDSGELNDQRSEQIIKEMGGAFWYFSRICKHLGVTPSDIMQANYEELFSRRERNKIKGDGDDR